jgi:glycosyltransferase involved in cell wall biosynthesis
MQSYAVRNGRRVCLHRVGAVREDVRGMRAATTLWEAGYDVSIIDLDPDQSYPAELDPGMAIHHLTLKDRDTTTWFKPALAFKMLRHFSARVRRLLQSEADIYHALEVDTVLACFVAGLLRRKPVVYEVYDLPYDSPYFRSNVRRSMYRKLMLMLLRCVLPHLNGVIAASPDYGRLVKRQLGGPDPVIVRNIPDYQPPVTSDTLRQQLGLSPTTKIALYQGYFLANRALDALIQAAKYVDANTVIVLMGKGPIQPQLEALIQQEGLADRVKIVPYVAHADLLQWTASADLGLCLFSPDFSLNIRYTLPNKLFEYLMAGLPVLTTQLDALADLVQHYDVGAVVPAFEPQAMGQAISAVLADDAGRARMRHNALAATATELRWDVEKQRLLHLYDTIFDAEATATPMEGNTL